MGTSNLGSADYFGGWTREIMPFAEDGALQQLYVDRVPITAPEAKIFRETIVPMYNCPSDFQTQLALPHSGPASGFSETSPTAPVFRTSSYRGNAGRGDGFVTWYLYEDLPGRGAVPSATGLHKGWRGPLHAQVIQGGAEPRDTYVLRRESIKDITDGTTKTLLVGESTNIFPRRRTFLGVHMGQLPVVSDGGSAKNFSPVTISSVGNLVKSDLLVPPITGRSFRTCMSSWWSGHTGGINGAFCDGSGRWIGSDIDRNVFAGMGSIAGQEVASEGLN